VATLRQFGTGATITSKPFRIAGRRSP
jgi:hypothetical protein